MHHRYVFQMSAQRVCFCNHENVHKATPMAESRDQMLFKYNHKLNRFCNFFILLTIAFSKSLMMGTWKATLKSIYSFRGKYQLERAAKNENKINQKTPRFGQKYRIKKRKKKKQLNMGKKLETKKEKLGCSRIFTNPHFQTAKEEKENGKNSQVPFDINLHG